MICSQTAMPVKYFPIALFMKRWQITALGVVVLVCIAVAAGYRIGVGLLRDKVVDALGPGTHLTQLKVNWFSIDLSGLSIDAPKGWPTTRTLEAERVTIVPDLRTLFTDKIRIASIVIHKPYFSALRNPGKLIIVPSLTGRDASEIKPAPSRARAVVISTIELRNGSLDLYDTTVSHPPLRTRIEEINATIEDVAAPTFDRIHFNLVGLVKGVKRDGRAKLSGWIGPGARDSSSRVVLEAVDLVALQPYLIKKNEARVASGTLDLNLVSEVRNNNLNGKGKVILQDLEFARARGYFDTFMGVPRDAVMSFMKDNHDAIAVDFILTGNTSNPNFSLNESLSTRIATAMAGQLGVSVRSVAEDLGTLGRKGMEGAGAVIEGVGGAVKRLFGK
jgi:uncharacterized protein DUF748